MLYTPSVLGVGQLSGKGGSVVAAHNRYGSYLRNRTVPTNPNSTSQQGVRGVFGGLAQRWRTLTDSQRQGWTDLSAQTPILNRQGNQIILAGNAFYSRVNMLRDAVGDSVLDTAPALDSPSVISTLSVDPDAAAIGGPINVAYTATGGSANNNMIIRASAPRSPGKDYVGRSELRQVQIVAGNVATPVDISAAYEAVFGTTWQTQVGMEIVVELFPVSENGLPGVGVKAQGTIHI